MKRKAVMAGIRELESLAAEFAPGPLLVHSDIMKAAAFVGEYRGKEAFLESPAADRPGSPTLVTWL